MLLGLRMVKNLRFFNLTKFFEKTLQKRFVDVVIQIGDRNLKSRRNADVIAVNLIGEQTRIILSVDMYVGKMHFVLINLLP